MSEMFLPCLRHDLNLDSEASELEVLEAIRDLQAELRQAHARMERYRFHQQQSQEAFRLLDPKEKEKLGEV